MDLMRYTDFSQSNYDPHNHSHNDSKFQFKVTMVAIDYTDNQLRTGILQ